MCRISPILAMLLIDNCLIRGTLYLDELHPREIAHLQVVKWEDENIGVIHRREAEVLCQIDQCGEREIADRVIY